GLYIRREFLSSGFGETAAQAKDECVSEALEDSHWRGRKLARGLSRLFSQCGKIITLRILYDNKTGFVARRFHPLSSGLTSASEAEDAIKQLNGYTPEEGCEPITVSLPTVPARPGRRAANLVNSFLKQCSMHSPSGAKLGSPIQHLAALTAQLQQSPINNGISGIGDLMAAASSLPNSSLLAQSMVAQGGGMTSSGSWSIFVYNLAPETEDRILWELFWPVWRRPDGEGDPRPGTSKCRGFGFVTMSNYEEALLAIQSLNGSLGTALRTPTPPDLPEQHPLHPAARGRQGLAEWAATPPRCIDPELSQVQFLRNRGGSRSSSGRHAAAALLAQQELMIELTLSQRIQLLEAAQIDNLRVARLADEAHQRLAEAVLAQVAHGGAPDCNEIVGRPAHLRADGLLATAAWRRCLGGGAGGSSRLPVAGLRQQDAVVDEHRAALDDARHGIAHGNLRHRIEGIESGQNRNTFMSDWLNSLQSTEFESELDNRLFHREDSRISRLRSAHRAPSEQFTCIRNPPTNLHHLLLLVIEQCPLECGHPRHLQKAGRGGFDVELQANFNQLRRRRPCLEVAQTQNSGKADGRLLIGRLHTVVSPTATLSRRRTVSVQSQQTPKQRTTRMPLNEAPPTPSGWSVSPGSPSLRTMKAHVTFRCFRPSFLTSVRMTPPGGSSTSSSRSAQTLKLFTVPDDSAAATAEEPKSARMAALFQTKIPDGCYSVRR
uniref:RRM domain-containing protein n=1 Tax=Macrostomum lignano TaxID=282301 RepID=A0A1I8JRI9_9PLAT